MFFEKGVLKVCNIHRETPVLESLLSKVASLETYKFIKKRLQLRCFPEKITFEEFKEHHRWVLLYLKFTGNWII